MLGMFRSEEVGGGEGGYRDFLMLLSLRIAWVTLYLVVVLVHIPSIFPWVSCLLFGFV